MLNIYSQVQNLGTISPTSRLIQPITDHLLATFTANNNLSDWTFKIAFTLQSDAITNPRKISLPFKWNNLPGWQTKHYKLFIASVCFSQPLLQWCWKRHAELTKYQIFAQLHQTFSTAFSRKFALFRDNFSTSSLLWKQVYRTAKQNKQNKHRKHFCVKNQSVFSEAKCVTLCLQHQL